MKSPSASALLSSLLVTSLSVVSAQVTFLNGTFTCPSANTNQNFCAGTSLQTNIIIRCTGTVGQPGNCNDNLAGIPPVGVKDFAPCFESSPAAGNAACSFNGIAYPDTGAPFNISSGTPVTTSSSGVSTTTSTTAVTDSNTTTTATTGTTTDTAGTPGTSTTSVTTGPSGIGAPGTILTTTTSSSGPKGTVSLTSTVAANGTLSVTQSPTGGSATPTFTGGAGAKEVGGSFVLAAVAAVAAML